MQEKLRIDCCLNFKKMVKKSHFLKLHTFGVRISRIGGLFSRHYIKVMIIFS